MDPRGFPTSLPEFQRVFPNDEACAKYLEALRWPEGFVCPKCGVVGEPYRFPTRSSVVLRCRTCKVNTSLTAGTTMQSSHTPLSTWFWGAYLITTQTPGQSALQFQRQLGLSRYETAYQILHKLRSGMVNPERDLIGGKYPVEVDECYVGGRTQGEGRGVHHMALVAGAIEVRRRAPPSDDRTPAPKRKRSVYAGRLRLRVVSGLDAPPRSAEALSAFVLKNIARRSVVRTDGYKGYADLVDVGYRHEALTLRGDPDKAERHLPLIHLVFSNLQTWLLGTHHGVSQHHLQAYLNEYVFRFNRRFYPMTAFNSVLGLAVNSPPPTYAQLYSGAWKHPA